MAQLGYGDVAVHKLIYARQDLQVTVRDLLTDLKDLPLFCLAGAGDRDDDLRDPVFLRIFKDRVPSSHDFYSVDIGPVFSRVIIDDAAQFGIQLCAQFQFFHDHVAGFSRSDDHGIPHMRAVQIAPVEQADQPV